MKKYLSSVSKPLAFGIVTASALYATTASAAVDLAGVTTAFGDLTTALTTVGGLILTAAVTAVIYKWIKGMIFS